MLNSLCFLPLDIPPFKNKDQILKNFETSALESYVWWNMEVVLGHRNLEHPLGSYTGEWTDNAKLKYPELIDYVQKYLPFSRLCYIHLSRAVKTVLPHVDENYVERPFPHHMNITPHFKDHLNKQEPVGYRFIISGNRNSLYFCKKYDPLYKTIYEQKKYFCKIPTDTDFFVLRNSAIPHGVENTPQDSKRLIGFILGYVDPAKHIDLLEKSFKKYQSYSLTKEQIFS